MPGELEKIQVLAQEFSGVVPTMVLGSGASCAHGMPGMRELQQYLLNNLKPNEDESQEWAKIADEMAKSGLELALTKVAPASSITERIVDLTWEYLSTEDNNIRRDLLLAKDRMPLAALFMHLFATTHREIDIVTTNYDRLAEFAAESVGYFTQTGFFPGAFSKRNSGEPLMLYSGQVRIPTVNIWKVHGSLGWFEDQDRLPIQAAMDVTVPEKLKPLIVTPGVDKHRRTQFEPFRTIMTNADTALINARGYMCIGFGFRDQHIEPKIIERFRAEQVPIIVLSYELTPETKSFLKNYSDLYLAIENCQGGSRCFYSGGGEEGVTLQQENLWTISGFMSLIT